MSFRLIAWGAGILAAGMTAGVRADEGTEPSSRQAVQLKAGKPIRMPSPSKNAGGNYSLWALPFEIANQTGEDRDLVLTFAMTTDIASYRTVQIPGASENVPAALRTERRPVYEKIYGGDDEPGRRKLQELQRSELLPYAQMNGMLRAGQAKRGAVFFTEVPEEAKQFTVSVLGLSRTQRKVRSGKEYHHLVVNGLEVLRIQRDAKGGPPDWVSLVSYPPLMKDKYERALQVDTAGKSVEDQLGPNDVFESLRFTGGQWTPAYFQVNKKDPILREPDGTVFHERWMLELSYRRPPNVLQVIYGKLEHLGTRWLLLTEATQ